MISSEAYDTFIHCTFIITFMRLQSHTYLISFYQIYIESVPILITVVPACMLAVQRRRTHCCICRTLVVSAKKYVFHCVRKWTCGVTATLSLVLTVLINTDMVAPLLSCGTLISGLIHKICITFRALPWKNHCKHQIENSSIQRDLPSGVRFDQNFVNVFGSGHVVTEVHSYLALNCSFATLQVDVIFTPVVIREDIIPVLNSRIFM